MPKAGHDNPPKKPTHSRITHLHPGISDHEVRGARVLIQQQAAGAELQCLLQAQHI
jgi:hypothetical protein